MNDIKKPWITAAYELFAEQGPNGLKVEVIARKVNKNKSSFYHHFVEMDLFIERLLAYHLERSSIIAERERACKNIIPDLVDVLVDFKTDLLFNRQLRINRNIPAYDHCIQQTSAMIEDVFLYLWAREIGLEKNPTLARTVLAHSIENFYIKIAEETLNKEWLTQYFKEVLGMVNALKMQS